MRVLETDRLTLRPFTRDDLQDIQRVVYSDPIVCRFYCGKARSLDETRDWLIHRIWQASESKLGFSAVVRRQDEAMLGLLALQPYLADFVVFEGDPDAPFHSLEVELTYALGRSYWGQGYGTEAGEALIAHAFEGLRIRRLVNAVNGQNIPSIHLMKRLGFRLEKNLHPDGKDDVVGILDNNLA
jgi:RimJ/RimL family protein N-acetyltransferase